MGLGVALLDAVPAFAEPAGPAYVVDNGDAPPNAVALAPDGTPLVASDVLPPPVDDGSADVDGPVAPDAPTAVGTVPAAPPSNDSDQDPRALDEFMPKLDPYGTWIDDSSYGVVWVPDAATVGDGFSPYVSDGHWALDTAGNSVWMSDYSFGSIVFHYGRWAWTSRGWAWIPGYRYAPAWVSWRIPSGDYAYYGWAPLPPSFIWASGAPMPYAGRAPFYWVFCPSAFVYSPTPSSYVVRSAPQAHAIATVTRRYTPATARVAAPSSPPAARSTRYAWPVPRVFTAPRPRAYAMAGAATNYAATRPVARSAATRVAAPVVYRPAAPAARGRR